MPSNCSRRDFLAAGLALPVAGVRSTTDRSVSAADTQAKSDPVKLTHRTLGKTGLKVTSLAFGCMTTPEPAVIARAADIGINHFDTARSYQNGNNERMVGAALKNVRKKVIISSKSGAQTKEQLLSDLDTSLKELGTDYLDIWYLHMKNEPAEVKDELLEAQRIAKQSGKIRFAGVSTHFNMDRILEHLAKSGQVDVALTTYNFAMRSVASGMNTNPDAPKTDMTTAIQSARKSWPRHRGHEDHGGRREPGGSGRQALRSEPARTDRASQQAGRAGGGDQVGAQERLGRHRHCVHDRFRSAR